MSDITNQGSWQRAELSNKLLNYNSEISGEMKTDLFKQMVSGEPVNAQRKYQAPFMMNNYAKLMFNANELPKTVEHTEAYFRRFLIIPFNVRIPENERDTGLAKKIISSELSGVFNWVLAGLYRLVENKAFSHSDIIDAQLKSFQRESDSIAMFIEDEGYAPAINESMPLKAMYDLYCSYCFDSGYKNASLKTASRRLKDLGFESERRNMGVIIYVKQTLFFFASVVFTFCAKLARTHFTAKLRSGSRLNRAVILR